MLQHSTQRKLAWPLYADVDGWVHFPLAVKETVRLGNAANREVRSEHSVDITVEGGVEGPLQDQLLEQVLREAGELRDAISPLRLNV